MIPNSTKGKKRVLQRPWVILPFLLLPALMGVRTEVAADRAARFKFVYVQLKQLPGKYRYQWVAKVVNESAKRFERVFVVAIQSAHEPQEVLKNKELSGFGHYEIRLRPRETILLSHFGSVQKSCRSLLFLVREMGSFGSPVDHGHVILDLRDPRHRSRPGKGGGQPERLIYLAAVKLMNSPAPKDKDRKAWSTSLENRTHVRRPLTLLARVRGYNGNWRLIYKRRLELQPNEKRNVSGHFSFHPLETRELMIEAVYGRGPEENVWERMDIQSALRSSERKRE